LRSWRGWGILRGWQTNWLQQSIHYPFINSIAIFFKCLDFISFIKILFYPS
jgi:hypothetical protein